MSQYFEIHPDNPQTRLIDQAVRILQQGGVIAYPTDSSYALGCHIGDKSAMERIRRIRGVDESHHFTLMCPDLSELGVYAKVDNTAFRLLKRLTPGPYTFILPATREVPRRLQHPKRQTIGLRVPNHNIAHALMAQLGEPILSSTLQLPGEDMPRNIAWEIREDLEHALDLVIDGGACPLEPTTVIDFVDGEPHITRRGAGDLALLESLF
jgi:tRNA threonylcarbamoyl adenosine modification protein (Sua5/YciO/YrdC/YwlC family)